MFCFARLLLAITTSVSMVAENLSERPLSLAEAEQLALEHNLELRIQRHNPEIARLMLRGSYGIYDPVLYAETHREKLADSGGYDPADFSKDAVYTAKSHTARLGLTGTAPLGMTYSLSSDYANSSGQRNFTFFDSYNLNLDVGISQPLLRDFWIDQGRMTIKVQRRQLQISKLALTYSIMSILNQVHQAYFELAFARTNLFIQSDLQRARTQFLQGVQRQVEGGRLTAPDGSLARSQLAMTAARVEEARMAVALAENSMRFLLGSSFAEAPEANLVPSESASAVPRLFDFKESVRSAIERRPDLAWLREEAEKANIDLKFRYNQLFPSLNLVAGWGRKGANTAQDFWAPTTASSRPAFDEIGHGSSPSDMVGVVLTVPLSRTAERAQYRQSKERKEQARLYIRQKEELVSREVADALARAESGLRRVDATRDAVRHAQAVLEAEERKLTGGKSTVLFVLQFQDALCAARAAEQRARADYSQACVQLAFAESSLLERRGIQLP